MAALPSGTVTFLFTDIEGSTARWEQQPEAMRAALARHDALVRAAIHEHNGHVVKTMGDAFHAAFARAPDAVAAALDAQRRLEAESWGELGPPRVRMGLHTGVAEERDGDYYGPPLNRAARLMSAGHGGQVLISQATYELVRDALSEGTALVDLGEHRLKDLIRPERIYQLVAPGLPFEFPPLRTLGGHPHNLPIQPTPLIGREREIQSVSGLLSREDTRLVTLTGPGGIGKTRLGLQVAANIIDRYEDGVFLVELATISDPSLVASTMAQTLSVAVAADRPVIDALVERLRDRRVLLVLDNFEQVLAAAMVVDDVIRRCPTVSILVTSRASLQLRGEHEFPVPPLVLPNAGRSLAPAALSQYEAVALFIERATAIRPDFAITNANAPAVAEICTRLDGLPLAIELAAARIRLLPPEALLARLGHSLDLLSGGRRDLPPRQQTLRSAIAWSYDLLTESERALFCRLSIFVGGWTLEAAESVCNLGDLDDVLIGLESLISKSLVRQDDEIDRDGRFRMLQTIREYGSDLLGASGEAATVRQQYSAYYVGLAEVAEPAIRGERPGQVHWLGYLEREHDNLRLILSWGQADGADPLIALRLSTALAWFWYIHGHVLEGWSLLERALSTPCDASPALRGNALHQAGHLAFQAGDLIGAERRLDASLQELRAAGDRAGVAFALTTLGTLCFARGDLDGAVVHHSGAIALFREMVNAWGTGHAMFLLAQDFAARGDVRTAVAMDRESLETRPPWDEGGLGITHRELARLALRQEDHSSARLHLREALRFLREVGSRMGMVGCLESSARLALPEDRADRAVRLLGCALRMREVSGVPGQPADRADLAERAAQAREVLGERAFADAWADGQSMSLEQGVRYALEGLDSTR